MQRGSSARAGAAALMLLAAFATACGGSSGGDGAGTKPTPSRTGAASGGVSGGVSAGSAHFDTVFGNKDRLRSGLPDPGSMRGWTPERGDTYIAEDPKGPSDCGPDAAWDCTSIANGRAEFDGGDETADFHIEAFADQKAAQDACRKEAAWSAQYSKAEVPQVEGTTSSHAYYRNAGGLNGINLTMCLGTVVATTTLENGSMDPDELHQLAGVFAARIQKAAAAS